MMRGGGQAWILIGALMVAGTLAQAGPVAAIRENPVAAETETVEVVARRMRTVRLSFRLFGPHLKACDVVVSSGDPGIDSGMCRMLDSCVRAGRRDRASAMTCVNDRIAALEPASGPPRDSTPDTGGVPAEASGRPETTGEQDIVLTGRPAAPLAGLWRFTEGGRHVSSDRAMSFLPRHWRMSIPAGKAGVTIATMLAEPLNVQAPPSCRRWQVRVAGQTLTGDLACQMRGAVTTGTLEGTFGETTLNVVKRRRTRFLLSGRQSDGVFELAGTRIGTCLHQGGRVDGP